MQNSYTLSCFITLSYYGSGMDDGQGIARPRWRQDFLAVARQHSEGAQGVRSGDDFQLLALQPGADFRLGSLGAEQHARAHTRLDTAAAITEFRIADHGLIFRQ